MTMKRVDAIELTDEQRKLLCEVLNHADERHRAPHADNYTLDHFGLQYAIDCTQRAYNKLRDRMRNTGSQMGDALFAAQLDALYTMLKAGAR